jgi:hypothetical protein
MDESLEFALLIVSTRYTMWAVNVADNMNKQQKFYSRSKRYNIIRRFPGHNNSQPKALVETANDIAAGQYW